MNQQIPVMKLISSKVTLQVFERNKKDSTLAEAANWEVVLSGRLEIKIWKRFQHCGYLSEREPTLLKKNSADTTSILGGNKKRFGLYFNKNPASKPRDEKTYRKNLVLNWREKRNSQFLFYGPAGKGRDDILTEFSRAEGIENFYSSVHSG